MSKSERPPDLSLFLDLSFLPKQLDSTFIDAQVQALGEDVIRLWQAIKEAAQEEAQKA